MLSKSEEYRREAQRVHNRAECAKISQERETLLEIERAFERLVALEEWLEANRRQVEEVMTPDVITVSDDTPLEDIVRIAGDTAVKDHLI